MIEPYVKPGVSTGELDRICKITLLMNNTRFLPASAITAIQIRLHLY